MESNAVVRDSIPARTSRASTHDLPANLNNMKISHDNHPHEENHSRASDAAPGASSSAARSSRRAAPTAQSSTHSTPTTSSALSGQQQQGSGSNSQNTISYTAECVIGNGSFGVVFQASVVETGEKVAIKKVLQDKRFKNRELQIMRLLKHPTIVTLKHCFFSNGDKPNELYLNLVLEFVPETIYRLMRNLVAAKQFIPILDMKCYMYQLCRALSYLHAIGVCHRDIKPQNLLIDPTHHVLKLCDFGSAKILKKGETNVSYICSRYYRAPELIFGASDYTTAIDIWSMGCVMAEMLLGHPLFPGECSVDQLVEIIKILGTPTREEIQAMCPNYTESKFPKIRGLPWNRVFRSRTPPEAIDLVSQFLRYRPETRLKPIQALVHPMFAELRQPSVVLSNGKPPPPLFNFTQQELDSAAEHGIPLSDLVPPHILQSQEYKVAE